VRDAARTNSLCVRLATRSVTCGRAVWYGDRIFGGDFVHVSRDDVYRSPYPIAIPLTRVPCLYGVISNMVTKIAHPSDGSYFLRWILFVSYYLDFASTTVSVSLVSLSALSLTGTVQLCTQPRQAGARRPEQAKAGSCHRGPRARGT
jgi:hypothetical protein